VIRRSGRAQHGALRLAQLLAARRLEMFVPLRLALPQALRLVR
jgi:hypothetical protein